MRKIGFAGIGNMGVPMAGNLGRAGFEISVYDVSAEAAARFAKENTCRVAESPAALARDSDVLILMLPDGKIVQDFLFGAGGAAEALNKGAIVIDMSSSDPTGTQETGRRLGERGIGMIDAPVSGGVSRAKSGTLAIMVGGEKAIFDGLADVFAALGSTTYVGKLGAGHAMKALNNYVSAAGLLAACEALRVAETFGLASDVVVKVLNSSTGRNNSTENKLMQYVVSGAYNSGFSIGLMSKDLATARGLARDLNIDLPMGDMVVDLWADAAAKLGKNADHTEIARIVETP